MKRAQNVTRLTYALAVFLSGCATLDPSATLIKTVKARANDPAMAVSCPDSDVTESGCRQFLAGLDLKANFNEARCSDDAEGCYQFQVVRPSAAFNLRLKTNLAGTAVSSVVVRLLNVDILFLAEPKDTSGVNSRTFTREELRQQGLTSVDDIATYIQQHAGN